MVIKHLFLRTRKLSQLENAKDKQKHPSVESISTSSPTQSKVEQDGKRSKSNHPKDQTHKPNLSTKLGNQLAIQKKAKPMCILF